jgi:hypothetical protein
VFAKPMSTNLFVSLSIYAKILLAEVD